MQHDGESSIETGIPVPLPHRGRQPNPIIGKLRALAPNDSLFFKAATSPERLRIYQRMYQRARRAGVTIIMRSYSDGVRLWRK